MEVSYPHHLTQTLPRSEINSLCTKCISHTPASHSAIGQTSQLSFKISVYCVVYIVSTVNCFITRGTTAHNGMCCSWALHPQPQLEGCYCHVREEGREVQRCEGPPQSMPWDPSHLFSPTLRSRHHPSFLSWASPPTTITIQQKRDVSHKYHDICSGSLAKVHRSR